ncbi:MAG: hypothetical protein ACRDUW_21080, partial [Pseudonocardiaceae bacterium]
MTTRSNWAATSVASGWSKMVRTRVTARAVDEPERRHARVTQLVHLGENVVRVAGADGDVGVGRDRGAAERAVIRAAPRPDHVGLPSPGLQVRV